MSTVPAHSFLANFRQAVLWPYHAVIGVVNFVLSIYYGISSAIYVTINYYFAITEKICNVCLACWSAVTAFACAVKDTWRRGAAFVTNSCLSVSNFCHNVITSIVGVFNAIVMAYGRLKSAVFYSVNSVHNFFASIKYNIKHGLDVFQKFIKSIIQFFLNFGAFISSSRDSLTKKYLCAKEEVSSSVDKSVIWIRSHKLVSISCFIAIVALFVPLFSLLSDMYSGEFDSAAEKADRYGRSVQVLYLLIYRALLEPILWLLKFVFSSVFSVVCIMFESTIVFLYDALSHAAFLTYSVSNFVLRYVYYTCSILFSIYERYAINKEVIFIGFCMLLLRIWFFPSSSDDRSSQMEVDGADDDLLPLTELDSSQEACLSPHDSEEEDEEMLTFLPEATEQSYL